MIHVNPSRVQTRRACDRCHQAKLKCVREGHQRCRRCEQTDTDCTFSPPTRIRRHQIEPSVVPSAPFGGLEQHLDGWSDMGGLDIHMDDPLLLTTFALDTELPTPISMPPPQQSQNHYDNLDPAVRPTGYDELLSDGLFPGSTAGAATAAYITDPSTSYGGSPTADMPTSSSSGFMRGGTTLGVPALPPSPDEEVEDDGELLAHALWTERVAQLNIRFMQHLRSIPGVRSESLDDESGNVVVLPPDGRHNSDHTFTLSESFIDILSGMCSKQPPLRRTVTAIYDDKDGPGVCPNMDDALYLMVLSAYLHFLATHDKVFRYLLACLVHRRETTDGESCFYLPKLTIGSFSLARTSETRPLLFVNLMESMLSRARNLIHRLVSAKKTLSRRAGQGSFAGLPPIIEPGLALRAIQSREAAIINQIERIKTALSQSG